jgi:homoserine kinase type II
MESVFVVQHLRRHADGEENVKLIGVYRSATSARAAIDRLKAQPGFRDNPNVVDALGDTDDQGFHVAEYPLDKDHWAEGFGP